jgi:hypothetical protein
MNEPTLTQLLRRAIALMLDKLNEHNPETGYLFAIDHGLVEYLTMLTLAHACTKNTVPVARALEVIKRMEEQQNARYTGTH